MAINITVLHDGSGALLCLYIPGPSPSLSTEPLKQPQVKPVKLHLLSPSCRTQGSTRRRRQHLAALSSSSPRSQSWCQEWGRRQRSSPPESTMGISTSFSQGLKIFQGPSSALHSLQFDQRLTQQHSERASPPQPFPLTLYVNKRAFFFHHSLWVSVCVPPHLASRYTTFWISCPSVFLYLMFYH